MTLKTKPTPILHEYLKDSVRIITHYSPLLSDYTKFKEAIESARTILNILESRG